MIFSSDLHQIYEIENRVNLWPSSFGYNLQSAGCVDQHWGWTVNEGNKTTHLTYPDPFILLFQAHLDLCFPFVLGCPVRLYFLQWCVCVCVGGGGGCIPCMCASNSMFIECVWTVKLNSCFWKCTFVLPQVCTTTQFALCLLWNIHCMWILCHIMYNMYNICGSFWAAGPH